MINIHLDQLVHYHEELKIRFDNGNFVIRLYCNDELILRGEGATIIDALLDLDNELLQETIDTIRDKVK